ncbi:hypothetical protein GTQ40_11525 [Flavobacteriaceae bacterium R38]|nr:hypothetical protein [Flavobacteriaceae bacterium R38]
MNSIAFKKHRSARAWYIGGSVSILGLLGWGNWNQVIILGLLGVLIVAFGSHYIITSDYNNKHCYSFFGITFLKKRLEIIYPDYISIFTINEKRSNEYGPVSALGSISKDAFFFLRIFKENKHFTLYKSNDYHKVLSKGNELKAMLKIELIDKIKK